MAVQQLYAPHLTQSVIATVLAKTVATLTLADLHTLEDAIKRQNVHDTTKTLAQVFLNSTAPTVTAASLASPGDFVTNGVMAFTVTFSDYVYVTGTPEIHVVIGSNTRQATYVSGTDTESLVFHYTVVSGDSATAGNITVATNALVLNSGTIIDENGNAATLTLPTVTGAAASSAN